MSRYAALEAAILHGVSGARDVERIAVTVTELGERHVVVETSFELPDRLPHGAVVGLQVRRGEAGLLAIARRIERAREIPGEIALEVVGAPARVTTRIAELAG